MADWEAKSVYDVVQDIHDGRVVLPVIQRRLVWDEAKMELLFDSLLKGNSFGGIMVLQESQGDRPLFAYRRFSIDGEEPESADPGVLHHSISLVIDGQQRLQAFYMGLRGSIHGKRLYLNLLSGEQEYEFRFAHNRSDLPIQANDNGEGPAQKLWYAVPGLFGQLHAVKKAGVVATGIANEASLDDLQPRNLIRDNVEALFSYVFMWKAIGISSVMVNKAQVGEEKRRIVELFRRLNDGGTRLSSFDLVASVLKGLDYRMEGLLRRVREFADIGIRQDEAIKLMFLLRDEWAKEVTDITPEDADFFIAKEERILQSLRALRTFLKNARLYDYYAGSGRSVIPLYFVAYHVFHKDEPDAELAKVYDNFDAKNDDFLSLKRWMYLSILNGVFSRGKGWIPYRTGIRKILNALKAYKGQIFPCEALFEVYGSHPLTFSTELAPERLDLWDRDFVFYLIYDCQPLTGRDIDHVHPKSRLDEADVEPHKIHSIANFQLLDERTNRTAKRAKTLADWLRGDGVSKGVSDLSGYLTRHLIPKEESVWEIEGFDTFLAERASMICECVREAIPEPVAQPELPVGGTASVSETSAKRPDRPGHPSLDTKTLLQELSPSTRNEPVLRDDTPWLEIFRQANYHPVWAGRYANGLASLGIHTVGDLALCIMARGVEVAYMHGERPVLEFHEPIHPGSPTTVTSFGGWGWHTTLNHLREKGLDWQDYVVTPEPVMPQAQARSEQMEVLHDQLSAEQQAHSILDDATTWETIFKARDLHPTWVGRYRNQLAGAGIATVGDMALSIMTLGLEFRYSEEWGNVFHFARPAPDGEPVEFETRSFGAWAWTTALDELENRGFDWKPYVVNPDELRENGKQ